MWNFGNILISINQGTNLSLCNLDDESTIAAEINFYKDRHDYGLHPIFQTALIMCDITDNADKLPDSKHLAVMVESMQKKMFS